MPTAILSVYDKTGILELAQGLAALGYHILSSGGTAKHLAEHGIACPQVAAYTGSPEILGGRVKTLHPAISGGLLARPTHADEAELASLGWGLIDLAVVNLYPFEQTVAHPGATHAQIIEQIDIGGVTLIRAAAKNYARVTLLCDPADYPAALANLRQHGSLPPATRQWLAAKGFAVTARYDAAISAYFTGLVAGTNTPKEATPADSGS